MAHPLTLFRSGRERFRRWRRTRPFWGGVLLVAAGVELLVAPAAQSLVLPIDLVVYAGIAGVSGPLIAFLLIALGVLGWLQPAQHTFFGLVGLMLALVSFVTSNFGGFAVGMLLGIVGGALVFAWAPDARRRRRPRGRRAKAAETVTGPGEGSRHLASIALPVAAAVTLASAPAPAAGWPWDWFLPGDDEEQSEEQPTEKPSDEASGAPGAEQPGAGEPEDDDGEGTGDADEQDAEEEAEEEPEERSGEDADPTECELRVGDDAVVTDEEDFLAVVLACRAAQEEGGYPEVVVDSEYDCFRGSVRDSGLTADSLTMFGARYRGVVECPTADGARSYIKLTMSSAEFRGAELWFDDLGTRRSLGLPTMDMTGDVEMHVTRMHVRILGIPLTFTPDFPPPLLLPFMYVTGVDVDHPMASTDVMTIPDLNGRYGGGA